MARGSTPLLAATALLAFAAGCSEPNEPPLSGPRAVIHHPADWVEPDADGFHGRELAARGYDFSECIECHGSGTAGGIAGVACTLCHGSPDGPEACNTCHGDFDADPADLIESAPPRGLGDEIDPLARPVGAHRIHLARAPARPAVDRCAECHTVPDALDSPWHLGGDFLAEVPLEGDIATAATEGGLRQPIGEWDVQAGTCATTYCHGNWGLPRAGSGRQWMYSEDLMAGNSAMPTWDDPSSGECGTCHDLPPVGHDAAGLDECWDCHGTVIDPSGEIIDASKHADGMIDLYDDVPYPMF